MALMPMFWGRPAMMGEQLALDNGFWREGQKGVVVGRDSRGGDCLLFG